MLMDVIKARHSIRKYQDKQIKREGQETFASEEGKRLMQEWEVPEEYSCQGFVILGYLDGAVPHRKPRREGRIRIVE